MSRPTMEEMRAKATEVGDYPTNPHYVEGRRAKKWNPIWYERKHGMKRYLKQIAKDCAENPSSTFHVTFYGEHRELPTRYKRSDGSWKRLTRREKIGETKSGTNRSGEIDHAAQAKAHRKLQELGVSDDQITFEARSEDVDRHVA